MPASTAKLKTVITDVPDRYTRVISLRGRDARPLRVVAVMERTVAKSVQAPMIPKRRHPRERAGMSGPALTWILEDQAPGGARTGQFRSRPSCQRRGPS